MDKVKGSAINTPPRNLVVAKPSRQSYHRTRPLSSGQRVVAAMIVTPFAPLPRTILHDATLPPGAKTLYATLKDHARQRSSCYPGYRRLCAILKASEKTVRRWMRALIEAGYVEQTRRGHMRSNLYTLTPFAHVSTAETGILERELCPPIKTESLQDSSTKDIREAHTFCAALPPEPDLASAKPLPADVAALVADISREMRDTAPKSTCTRVRRILAKSDKPMDMYAVVQGARATTRRRLSRIRNRASSGQACAMPYFLAVLAHAVDGTPRPQPPRLPINLPPHTPHPEPPRPPQPPIPRPPQPERIEFWAAIREATGISDLRSYCRLTGRPPVYDDLRRSVGLVKDARGNHGC